MTDTHTADCLKNGYGVDYGCTCVKAATPQTGWCPSCGCGWDAQPLPFQVNPPEGDCKQILCDCHESWRWETQAGERRSGIDQLSELEKRYLWGDR